MLQVVFNEENGFINTICTYSISLRSSAEDILKELLVKAMSV